MLKMTEIHQWRKMNFSALCPTFFCFWLWSAVMSVSSPIFSFFFHCSLRTSNFQCLRNRNKLMQYTAITEWIYSFCSNVIFVIPAWHTFQSYSHRFVGIVKRVLSCVSQFCGGLSHCSLSVFCKALLTSNFPKAAFIVSLNSSSFGSMKNIPLDSPSLFCILFRCIGQKFPHIWPYIIKTRGCLFPCKSPPGPCASFWWPLLQQNKSCESCPCIWQFFFSIHVPVLFNVFLQQTSSDVNVVLVTSMYFIGIGNDSSFGTHSFALGSTWWRWMNSHVKVQKSLLASSSSRVDSSWSVGECNSSDFPWRISCFSPRSGRSRVKVDVLRRCSLP